MFLRWTAKNHNFLYLHKLYKLYYCLQYFDSLHSITTLKQIGVRTEGIQEALLKSPAADESVDHITKIKRTLRAVRHLYFIVCI